MKYNVGEFNSSDAQFLNHSNQAIGNNYCIMELLPISDYCYNSEDNIWRKTELHKWQIITRIITLPSTWIDSYEINAKQILLIRWGFAKLLIETVISAIVNLKRLAYMRLLKGFTMWDS